MSGLVQELTHKKYNEGSRRQEGREREGQNSGEQRHEEICGMEKDGGRDTRGKQDGQDKDFHVLTRQGLSGRKAGNLKDVGLEWINRGRKDRGFGCGKIRDSGERLF